MLSSTRLKEIVSEARPYIERQMDDAERIAGFRDVVAAEGGDWSALKALIKAHIKDERDDAGDGKHVRKILDKAEFSSGYADMLGWSNMNEQNFLSEINALGTYDAETGEVHDEPATEPQHSPAAQSHGDFPSAPNLSDGQGSDESPVTHSPESALETFEGHSAERGAGPETAPASDGDAFSAVKAQVRLENAAGVEPSSSTHPTPAERGQHDHGGQRVGREDGEQRDAARVSYSVGRGEGADEGDQGQGVGASGTDRHLRAVSRTELGQDQDGRSGDVGGEARHQVDPEAKASTGNGATERGDVEGPADSVTGDASRPAIGRSMAATSDDGRDSPERRAPIIPFHPEETREQRTLRLKPHCQRPSACGGVGRDYCYGCRKAMSAGGDAA